MGGLPEFIACPGSLFFSLQLTGQWLAGIPG
jgi:hypothetical protein